MSWILLEQSMRYVNIYLILLLFCLASPSRALGMLGLWRRGFVLS